jgi:hypothetical protein
MNLVSSTCQSCKKQFSIEPDDLAFYEKIGAPLPTKCPWCRHQQRLAFWPFGKFNKRTCNFSGERVISIYSAQAPFPVYRNAEWYSDTWAPPALTYDPSRPFFDQIFELQGKTPRPHQFGTQNTNCDYSDDVWESKNCYLCRSLLSCENLSYCYRTIRCRDSYDLCYCYDTEQSYDCIYCFKVFNVRHAFDVRDSFDSAFLYDCRNVRNCFFCWNVRNREYCIKNIQYTKEEYEKKLGEYRLNTQEGVLAARKEFEECLRNSAVHRANYNTKCVNSTGNYLTECKNCRECYFFENSENCSHIFRGPQNKDVHDAAGVLRSELVYNVSQLGDGYRLFHSNYCTNCRESEYLDYCFECEYCFGCVGLRKKKYCILNTQYSKEEYEALRAKIVDDMKARGEYGQFFPYRMACGGYNLSLAGIFFPHTEEEVRAMGALWEEEGGSGTQGREVYEPPNDIADVRDEVTGKALVCTETKRAFNVTPEELSFLRRHHIPLPREYPDVRTLHRIQRLFSIFSREATCYFCRKIITTFYPPEWGFQKIACDECYLKEVV